MLAAAQETWGVPYSLHTWQGGRGGSVWGDIPTSAHHLAAARETSGVLGDDFLVEASNSFSGAADQMELPNWSAAAAAQAVMPFFLLQIACPMQAGAMSSSCKKSYAATGIMPRPTLRLSMTILILRSGRIESGERLV